MRKADNFDASKWLVENKITFQSRLNQNQTPGVDVEVEDDMITLSGDSGEYDGFIEDDGTVNFTVTNDEEEFDDQNWKDILGDDHVFVKVANAIPTKVEALGDYVMITVKADDLTGINESKLNSKSKPKLNEELKNIESELESAGFSFGDGILGGVGSGGGGYYDFISDKINGYNIDGFNEDEFNKWYDSFSLDSFNSSDYDNEMMDDYEIDRNKISQIPPGFYNVGAPGVGGFAQIKDNGDVILYANPTLSDMDGEGYYAIFSVDTTGNIVKNMSKEEVATYLKQNLETPGSWAII
jgi:hypothetical protein